MHISTKLTAPLLAAAASAFAGCTGSSASSSIPAQTQSVHQSAGAAHLYSFHGRTIAGPFAGEKMNEQWAHRSVTPSMGNTVTYPPAKCANTARLFGSDNATGSLDEFCEDAVTGKPNALVRTLAGAAGWGVAVQPMGKLLAVGKAGGTISVYASAINPTTPAATLTLSGQSSGTNAYGLCWDDKGGLYATNWPANTVDYFANALTSGGPTSTITTTTVTEDYDLACDFDKRETGTSGDLLVYGFNTNSRNVDSDVAIVTLPSGPDTVVQTLGSLNTGNGFPGGLAMNAQDDLLANDQYGTLFDLGVKEPWNAAPAGSCSWGFNPNDLTNIAFDNTQKEVWAANDNFGGSSTVTYLQSNGGPPLNGACVTPGESGGPTAPITGEGSYLGVAVYPNLGD